MPRRPRLALIGAAVLAGALVGQAAPPQPPTGWSHLVWSHVVWRSPDPAIGGLSGLILSPDGLAFTALSDRAFTVTGSLRRDAAGRITGVTAASAVPLCDEDGTPLRAKRADAEEMVADPAGGFYVAFEAVARVARYATPDAFARDLPRLPAFDRLPENASFEALARAPDGTLYAVMEKPGPQGFAVYRFRGGAWTQPFDIPASGGFRATGAQIGPDGRFYLLERAFGGLRGFATRLRRFDLTAQGLGEGTTLVQTRFGTFDNLEAMAVWRDRQGLVATLLSDDNFMILQRTEFVELRLPD